MEFLFVAGHPALDFVNTLPVVRGAPVELLDTPASVLRWLEEAGLVGEADARTAIRRWAEDEEVVSHARRLRESLRSIVEAVLHGRRPPEHALGVVNALLSTSSGALRLQWDSGPTLVSTFCPSTAAAVLSPVAATAAHFLAQADRTLLRRCENPECVLYFYDTSKNHARRWCSMKLCGNRSKVAEYRRRHA